LNLGISISWRGATIDSVRSIAVKAERAGFDYLWLTEAWGMEALSTAGYLLGQTARIKIGIGVLNVFSRSAALIGMGSATLNQIAPKRFLLGLGTSGKAVVERWHGVPFSKPMERTKEYVEIVKRIASGNQVDYEGDIFKLSGFRLYTAPISELEIYIGAIGERNLKLAGEISDGAIVTMYPISKLEHALEIVQGSKSSFERSSKQKLFAYLPVKIVNSTEEEKEERSEVARNIGFYMASMGKYYSRNLSELGFASEISAIEEAYKRGGSQAAVEAVSDKLLDELSIIGSYDQVKEKLGEFPPGIRPVFSIDPLSKDIERNLHSYEQLLRELSH
jgi:alkanesulfonate monooxygenase SsuD/methylene tetrahydromethanopterin reductase-like flavin-dependent oxidoreductase (luciferase family)